MKRKKKKNTAQQQKQELRHLRNEFFKKIRQVAACFGDASAFDLLQERQLNVMFNCRMRPVRFINPQNGQAKTTTLNLRVLNRHLSQFLHHSFVPIKHSQTQLNYHDFVVYAVTLFIFWRDVHGNYPKIADAFKSRLPVFSNDFQDMWVDVELGIQHCIEMIGWLFSDFEESIVRFEQEKIIKISPYDLRAFNNNWIIELKTVENELVEIDGHRRRVHKLYYNNRKEIIPFTIMPIQLGIDGVMQAFPMQVFIQQHAINRMQERLSEQFVQMCYVNVIHAITSEPIPVNDKRTFLFPLTYNKAKLGYLRADVIGDKLVIRTFLFLTNNGTPEGKKLEEMIGLQKADKKYLGIDKLSTFILSDIKTDEQLKALFGEAGCGELFGLDRFLLDNPKDKEQTAAKFIANYLGI